MTANRSIPRGQVIEKADARGQRLIGALASGGGLLMVIGTMLPWFSLFAGLQSYSGLIGWNGWFLLAAGVLSAMTGALFLIRGTPMVRWSIGLGGFVLLAYTSWLLLQLLRTYHDLASDPLMVAALGPGLFVVLVGAALVFGTLFVKHE